MDLCFGKAKWKQEFIVEHKFDYINMEEYRMNSLMLWLKYASIYVIVLRNFLIYVADLVAVIFLFYPLKSFDPSQGVPALVVENVNLRDILKYIYLFCVAASVLLLAIDVRKARRIIKSRDISFAFTSNIAYRYYSIRSYAYYCFFEQISHATRTKDVLALFVFFRLKGMRGGEEGHCWSSLLV